MMAEVTASDHDAVEGPDDLVEVVDGLGLLDLGDDREAQPFLIHDPVDLCDVSRAAHKRQGNHVDPQAQGPAQVLLILVGHRRHAHRGSGDVDALVVGEHAALDDHARHISVGHVGDLEADLAVVDEDPQAGSNVTGQAGIRRADLLDVARNLTVGDGEGRALLQEHGTISESSGADLGALQVHEDAHGTLLGVAGRPHIAVDLLVHGVFTVAEVESGHVHPGADELSNVLGGRGGRAEGADDLGAAHGLNSQGDRVPAECRVRAPPVSSRPGGSPRRDGWFRPSAADQWARWGEASARNPRARRRPRGRRPVPRRSPIR